MSDNIVMNVQLAKIIHDGEAPHYEGEYIVAPSFSENIVLSTSGKLCTRNITVLRAQMETYDGAYTVKSSSEPIILQTAGKVCVDDITVEPVTMQTKTATPTQTQQIIEPEYGYDGLSEVIINPAPLQTKTATPSGEQQIIEPDSPNIGLSSVTVEPASLGTATATPTTSSQTIEPTAPNIGLSSVTVEPIPPEYIIPSGTINIAQNSTVDVSQYATAAVNVPPDTQQVDALIDRSITTVDSNATAVGAYAFARCQNLTAANLPLAETVGDNAFFQCTRLTSLSLPKVTSIGRQSVCYCNLLSSFSAPLLSNITGQEAFAQSRALTSITLPELTEVPSYTFDNCISLQTADFSKISSIGTAAFRNSISFNTLILRGSSLVALADVNVFSGTCFASSQTATLYVPQALISTYQNDATWSSLLSISGNQILQIEGSPYDNA